MTKKTIQSYFKNKLFPYREIFGLMNQHPAILMGLMVSSLLVAFSELVGIGLIVPLLQPEGGSSLADLPIIGLFIQWLEGRPLQEKVSWIALMMLGVAVVRGGFSYLSQILAFLMQVKVEQDLKARVFQQLLEVDLSFIHQEKSGNLFTILSTNTSHASVLILNAAQALVHVSIISVFSVLMFVYSWQLTLLALAFLTISFYLIKWQLSRKIKSAGEEVIRSTSVLNSVGLENISGMKLLHLFVRKRQAQQKFDQSLKEYCHHLFTRGKFVSLLNPAFNTLNAIGLAMILFLGSLILANQTSTWLTSILLFIVILYRLMGPATSLNNVRGLIVSRYPALRSVNDFLKRHDKPFMQDGTTEFEQLKHQIAFENLSFQYEASDESVLKNISFVIPRGKVTAIVGPSGSGKSTVVNLITRLYDPQEGRIAVDGIDLRQLTLNSWRTHVAVVSQDTFIFNDTVSTNLRFARQAATQQEIEQAAKLAEAHQFIQSLPQGYDTLLGDRGVRLSGGQQQRLAIARAFLADPAVLILDEATSSLDSETELAIQTSLNQLSQNRTVIAIAHRLSTIRNADNILLLDQGRIIEQGTHETLMQKRGSYWRLVQIQNMENPSEPPLVKHYESQ